MGVLASPQGRTPQRKPMGAREMGQVRGYQQSQHYQVTAPVHVASHATPPESPWVQWWRQNPDLLNRTRGLMGTLPPGYSVPGRTRTGAGGWATGSPPGGVHPGVMPARRRLR